MNILICGSSGEVGRDLVYYLSKKNKIYAFSRSQKKIKNKKVITGKIDFSKKFKFNKKIDLIINCIATHEFSEKKNIYEYLDSNLISIMNIIECFENKKIKIINLSTISIHSLVNQEYLDEKTEKISSSYLSITKYIGEKIFEDSSLDVINLRLPGVLCLNSKQQRPWINILINKIKNNKNIEIKNLSKKFNSIVDTKEISKFIDYIKNKKIINGTYNLAASKPIKMDKIISIIKKYFYSTSTITNKGNDKKSVIIPLNKINKVMKYRSTSVEKVLKRYMKEF
jgi:dTDP-4-dehydrorhamnose reductase